MKKHKGNGKMEFRYNEPKWNAPKHVLPESQELDFSKSPGIRARVMLEKALQSFEGVNAGKLEELNVNVKDLAKYRKEIKSALFAILKEENGYDIRLRSGAIAYLGALKFKEAADLVEKIALNTDENSYVRAYATETLGRINGRTTSRTLDQLLRDPVFAVKEKAIRAIGKMKSKKHLPALKSLSTNDTDAEIQYRAKAAANLITTGKMLKRTPRSNGQIHKTTAEAGNVKPFGRNQDFKPQTAFGPENRGGIDLITTQELERRNSEKPLRPLSYEVLTDAPKGIHRLCLRGDNIGSSVISHAFGKTYRIHEDELILDLPQKNSPQVGCSLGLKISSERFVYLDTNWLPEAPASPAIYTIVADTGVIWAKEYFGLKLKFYAPIAEQTAFLKLRLRMPKDNWRDLQFVISSKEIAQGEKVISGFYSAIPGIMEIDAALYTENGAACKFEERLMALPANPISLNVSPTSTSTIGEGPAHYNSSEDKFYCYANLQVSNGFPHSVTIGPKVTAKVTDGGSEKDNFSFNISTSTVPANSVRTVGIWMSFGGDTYDVFKNFGDVTIRLTLQTSAGDIVDSHVWAAMAQIKLALNFVGNFSATTRSQLQSVVDNESSAIYEQQNFFISDSARFLLPSSNSDFGRYRDIEMDDNKDSDCTSGSDEADDLRDDWSSPNDSWLDVWCVETLSGPPCSASVGGFSPVDGPTDKGGDNSGVIIKMSSANLNTTGGRNLMGIIIAHEVGHFLGLSHVGTSANFMAASTGGSNKDITHQQYVDMTEHGFVSRFVV